MPLRDGHLRAHGSPDWGRRASLARRVLGSLQVLLGGPGASSLAPPWLSPQM